MAKILIVEDHDPDVRQCVNLFRQIGIESFHVVTGAEQALNYLEAVAEGETETPLLIVVDLILGNGSGFEILRFWKNSKKLKQIPLIVWTVVESKTEREMCKMFGVSACVQKADGPPALLEAVSQLHVS